MGNIQKINSSFITAATASSVSTLYQDVLINGSLNISSSLNITGSVFIASPIRGNVISLIAVSNTASIDFRTGTSFTLTLANTANTHIRPIGFSGSQTVNILVTQNSVGLGTANFPSYVKQPSGSLYTGSQVLNAIDVLTLTAFNSTNIYISSVRNLV